MVRGSATPQEEYNCYKCNAVYSDCGAHLLFQVIKVINVVMPPDTDFTYLSSDAAQHEEVSRHVV